MDDQNRFFTIADVARLTKVPQPTLSRHLRERRFAAPTIPVGRRMIFDEAGAESVLAYYKKWNPWQRHEEATLRTPSALAPQR
jgi:hypothetical protein